MSLQYRTDRPSKQYMEPKAVSDKDTDAEKLLKLTQTTIESINVLDNVREKELKSSGLLEKTVNNEGMVDIFERYNLPSDNVLQDWWKGSTSKPYERIRVTDASINEYRKIGEKQGTPMSDDVIFENIREDLRGMNLSEDEIENALTGNKTYDEWNKTNQQLISMIEEPLDPDYLVDPNTGEPAMFAGVGDIDTSGLTSYKEGQKYSADLIAKEGFKEGFEETLQGNLEESLASGTFLKGKGLFGKEDGFLSRGFGSTAKDVGKFGSGAGKIAKIAEGIGKVGKGGMKGLFGGLKAGAGASGTGALAMGPAGWTMLALGLLGDKLFKGHTAVGKIFKLFSDERLKDNIEFVGNSPSGIPTYHFNYVGNDSVYKGVLSKDVPWATEVDSKTGYDRVDYSKIDVDFKRIS